VVSGQWTMGSKQWAVSGQSAVNSGHWTMGSGRFDSEQWQWAVRSLVFGQSGTRI
jgi:hypothetical protein